MLFRLKNSIVDGHLWWTNGDHPEDKCYALIDDSPDCADTDRTFLSEGRVVRYYRRPNEDGKSLCPFCGKEMHIHGWIDQGVYSQVVCPESMIIKNDQGLYVAIRQMQWELLACGAKEDEITNLNLLDGIRAKLNAIGYITGENHKLMEQNIKNVGLVNKNVCKLIKTVDKKNG